MYKSLFICNQIFAIKVTQYKVTRNRIRWDSIRGSYYKSNFHLFFQIIYSYDNLSHTSFTYFVLQQIFSYRGLLISVILLPCNNCVASLFIHRRLKFQTIKDISICKVHMQSSNLDSSESINFLTRDYEIITALNIQRYCNTVIIHSSV